MNKYITNLQKYIVTYKWHDARINILVHMRARLVPVSAHTLTHTNASILDIGT